MEYAIMADSTPQRQDIRDIRDSDCHGRPRRLVGFVYSTRIIFRTQDKQQFLLPYDLLLDKPKTHSVLVERGWLKSQTLDGHFKPQTPGNCWRWKTSWNDSCM